MFRTHSRTQCLYAGNCPSARSPRKKGVRPKGRPIQDLEQLTSERDGVGGPGTVLMPPLLQWVPWGATGAQSAASANHSMPCAPSVRGRFSTPLNRSWWRQPLATLQNNLLCFFLVSDSCSPCPAIFLILFFIFSFFFLATLVAPGISTYLCTVSNTYSATFLGTV